MVMRCRQCYGCGSTVVGPSRVDACLYLERTWLSDVRVIVAGPSALGGAEGWAGGAALLVLCINPVLLPCGAEEGIGRAGVVPDASRL